MEELRKLLYSTADDAIELTQFTQEISPNLTLSECFPYTAWRQITINGNDYRVEYEIKLKPIR